MGNCHTLSVHFVICKESEWPKTCTHFVCSELWKKLRVFNFVIFVSFFLWFLFLSFFLNAGPHHCFGFVASLLFVVVPEKLLFFLMRFYPDMVSPRKQSKVAVDLNSFLVLKVQPKTKVKLVCHQIGSVTAGPPSPPPPPLFSPPSG